MGRNLPLDHLSELATWPPGGHCGPILMPTVARAVGKVNWSYMVPSVVPRAVLSSRTCAAPQGWHLGTSSHPSL